MKSSLEIEAVVFLTPGGTDPTSEGVDHSPVLASSQSWTPGQQIKGEQHSPGATGQKHSLVTTSGQKKPHQEAMERVNDVFQMENRPRKSCDSGGRSKPALRSPGNACQLSADSVFPDPAVQQTGAPELEINHIIWVGPVPVTERGQGGGGRARVDSGGNWGEGDRGPAAMAHYKVEQDDWLTVYLKYLLFVFNFFFWVGGAAVMAVGVWTLVEKSGYLGVLASSTFAASAYILIFAGALVMLTGFLGFGAIIREDRGCLSAYFCLLLAIFLVELVAGVLAHVYYQRLSDELKQHLTRTLAENYMQPGAAEITASVDRLQQDFKCCGSNSSADWLQSSYILSPEAEGRRVPDSCCKTVVARCGQRAHPSNIYKVEGGCISKLEQFLADHLLLMGAVGIGVACLQPPPRVLSKVEGVDSGGADANLRAARRRQTFLEKGCFGSDEE
ncbi:hypothetical protein MJG53_004010 [Ovis ammon polii x Ovis aries]|uniref:Uncharacterized protein n=1 Tax=Ovis ammon polii x Ovis aries TaxID=2918886 RepID=A0ACB9V9C2_9CETA|nr:hypothetical protein MJG53_004010 [Ovis ammon polii x Ovis aries]